MTEQLFHRALKASLVCCLAVILTGCEELFSALDNPIQTFISMTTTDVKLTVGDTYQRQATTASPATIVYASSDATVATVDANGVVEAIAEGEATITASVAEVDYWTAASVSYKVIVKPAFVAATDITLDQTMKVIKLGGDALTITATTVPSDANYTWESDAAAIATVDETGKVTPVGVGIATITAKSGDVKATCKIFVGNEVALASSNYTVQNYDILKGNLLSGKSITIPDGVNVAFDGITTDQTVTCEGDATIYLTDGSTNTVNVSSINAQPGIKVGPTDKTLTIDAETAGDGILTAKGGLFAAGIGTGDSPSSAGGNITINGGTVNATGGTNAAGIGTGDAYSANNKCGAITINGGTVTATGGYYAAGIGTGNCYDNNNTCGVITINGGTVNATGGYYGAGIGTGCALANSVYATAECGNIIIAGGTVNATGGECGAGIGTGCAYAMSSKTASPTCGAITIGTGVTSVIATNGSAAPYSIGVGGTDGIGTNNQTCGTITIGATTYAAGVTTRPFTYPTAP